MWVEKPYRCNLKLSILIAVNKKPFNLCNSKSLAKYYFDKDPSTYIIWRLHISAYSFRRSVRVAERLALPTSDHGVTGSNPAGGEILPEPKRRFIAQSLSCSPLHRLEITEILLKGRKTLTHPSSIHYSFRKSIF